MSTVIRAMRIGTSVGTPSTAHVSNAAGAPPYWLFGSHGPCVSIVATTNPAPSGTNIASASTTVCLVGQPFATSVVSVSCH